METRLYYEAHITVAPYTQGSVLDASMQAACKKYGMRVSTFLMFHSEAQPDAFTSIRDKNLDSIKARMSGAVKFLRMNGHTVKRFKIEDTVLDSKHGDELPAV